MRPNLLFLPIQRRREEEEGFFDGLAASENFEEVLHSAQELDFGLCLYTIRDRIGDWEPHYDQIDVWFTDLKSDDDHYHSASGLSLVLLTAWKLSRDWGVNVRFLACSNATQEADEESGNEEESNTGISAITPVTDADQEVRDALQRLVESARLKEAEVEVFDGDLTEQLSQTGSGTLVLVGGSKVPTLAGVRNVIECTQQDCLFVCRSGTAE